MAIQTARVSAPRVSDEEIFDAVRACMGETGDKITMSDVSDAVGLTRVQIYNRFGSKSGLIGQFLMHHTRQFKLDLVQSFANAEDDAEAFVQIMLACISAGDSDPLFRKFFAPEEMGKMEGGSGAVLKLGREHWGSVLRGGIARGVFRADLAIDEMSDWLTFMEFSLFSAVTGFGKSLADCDLYVRQFILPALLAPKV